MATKKKENRVPVIDPRQVMFKQYYTDPESETFYNARASAIRAGYTEQYADNITAQQPKWFQELLYSVNTMRAEMLASAEKNLKTMVAKPEPKTIDEKKLWLQTSQYISGTLGKAIYSTRQEVTGADGRSVFASNERDSVKKPLETLFRGISPT
jgi:hypothetical protein